VNTVANREFFLSGDCEDPGYKSARDLPRLQWIRDFVNSLWEQYEPYADSHFLKDAQNHFLQRFWEMYLAIALLKRGFQIQRMGDEGPEFFVEFDGHRVWLEAIASGPGTGNDKVPESRMWLDPWVVEEPPTEKIILRFTNALDEKRKKYLQAVEKGIIQPSDRYLLAINSRGIPHACYYGGAVPYFIQAFLPFGHPTLTIDIETREAVDAYFQRREAVPKVSGATVSTKAFLEAQSACVSAILYSSVDCGYRPEALGGDFEVLHNPTAQHPLDRSMFAWCRQFFWRNGELEQVDPVPAIDMGAPLETR
jgi:hypothetical protein